MAADAVHTVAQDTTASGIASPGERWLIRALVLFSFCFSMLPAGLDWSLVEAETSFAESTLANQLEFGSVYLAGFWLAWRHIDWTRLRLKQSNLFLVAFVAYCVLSSLWSPYPFITFKRSVQLGCLMIVGLAMAPPVGGSRQILQVLMGTLTFLLVCSLFMVLLAPGIGIDYQLGAAWRGVFMQKNAAGAGAAICALLWLRETVDPRLMPRSFCVAGLLFALFMLVMAKSSTSLLVFLIGAVLYMLLRRQYVSLRHPWWAIGVAALALLIFAVHMFQVVTGHLPTWDDVAGNIGRLFGKNADLTGRTDIWALVMVQLPTHLWMGIGYGAFWLGEGGPAQYISDALLWVPLQSHNGYLDVLNELGIVGAVLGLGVLVRHMVLLGRLLHIDREESAIHCVFFALLLISNFTESELFRGSLFYNILFFYSAGSIASQVALHRMEQAVAARAAEPALATDGRRPREAV